MRANPENHEKQKSMNPRKPPDRPGGSTPELPLGGPAPERPGGFPGFISFLLFTCLGFLNIYCD